ncbi:DUF5906 domain-containing protein [Halomonas sp. A11-A]|uniref:DUF5906 domain-containing protein n=1 Tax=Halomonas sp. A11-A TaxID=2183985 RepID=UPI000D71D321|nr:DUF5906 domain-containing protein [Halomonas sp. A11-A]PWV71511.1 phage/plasmid primase-like uncharacterized protein [Halomonas sp. A11-A]
MNAYTQPPGDTPASYSAQDQLRQAMADEGIVYDDKAPIAGDGKLRRFHVAGDPPGVKNGWYTFHDDARPAGQFGCNKRLGPDVKVSFSAKGVTPLSPAERAALDKTRAAQKAKREAEEKARHQAAATRAQAMLAKARPVSEVDDHPYLKRKGHAPLRARVGAYHILYNGEPRLVAEDALLIPMVGEGNEIVSLQAIFRDSDNILARDRDYLAGGKRQGACLPMGQPQLHDGREVYVVCEGYATGLALRHATGHSVTVAFDANNLIHVAKRIARAKPDALILIAADNDQWTLEPVANPGLHYARQAAEAVGGLVAYPDFPAELGTPDPATGKVKGPTDFDDLRRREGDEAVKAVVEACLNALQGPDNGPQCPTPGAGAPGVPSVELEGGMATAGQCEHDMTKDGGSLERRQQQQAENARLQEASDVGEMVPTHMTVDEMCERLIYISEGPQVAYLGPRRTLFLSVKELAGLTLSAATLPSEDAKRPVPNARLWQEDARRVSVMTRTFAPGQEIICKDPNGTRAVNTWRPIKRWAPRSDITPFLDHLAYLLPEPEEREAFLDWLAHLEQKPGELPHYGWLHIAKHTGCGRNWLASVLARLWCGYVAPNVDLAGLLNSSFNGMLSEKLLAMVDEIQEGGNDNSYRYANQLKSIVNAEQRHINPKYGSQYVEFNACRWLVFSNHANALPIDTNDRRWRVVMLNAPPRDAAVYAELYAALKDPEFINAIGAYLAKREITGFNPGERPPNTLDKQAVVKAAKSMVQQRADEIMAHWPSELITNEDVALIFTEDQEKRLTTGMRRAMEDAGAESLDDPRRVIRGEGPKRIWLLRRPDYWRRQSASQQFQDEYAKARHRDERYPHSPCQVLATAAERQDIAQQAA